MAKDLRKKSMTPPAAPAGTPAATPQEHINFDENAPPLAPGSLHMTDWTKKQLQALGWKEGDPIPGDFSEQLESAREAYVTELKKEMHTATPDLPDDFQPHIPDIIQYDKLPPAKQREIDQSLARAQQQMQHMERQVQQDAELQALQVEGADPSVNEAIRQTEMMKRQQEATQQQLQPQPPDNPFVLENDVQEALAKEEAGKPAPSYTQDVPQPEPVYPPPEADTAGDDERTSAFNQHAELCQRCAWPRKVQYELELEEADKNAWIVAILSGKRFFKEVKALGGRVRIIFRTLNVHESKLILTQLRYDQVNGDVNFTGEYTAAMTEYRYALGVHQIFVNDLPLDEPADEDLGAIQYDETPDTPMTVVKAITDHINTSVVVDENLRRVIVRKHMQFERLVEKLEAMADDENF
jgi:hypothetical protein